MFRSLLSIAGSIIGLLLPVVSAEAGTILADFALSAPVVTSTEATFDVSLLFSGEPADQIEAYQLSVFGSSPLLTASDTDFIRFSYTAANSPSPLNDWTSSETIGFSGLELGFPFDTLSGPFIMPSTDSVVLGTLAVDLTGIAPGTPLNVTLAGGSPGLQTDIGGTFDGQFVLSVADSGDPNLMLTFSDPAGVSFTAVPEPSSLVLWSCFGFVLLIGRRTTR